MKIPQEKRPKFMKQISNAWEYFYNIKKKS